MKLMCVQPCILYYAWQVEVMLENFKRLEIHREHEIHCLFAYNRRESDWEKKFSLIQKVERRYYDVAKFYYYEDTRVYPVSYISSIRPNILKQHFLAHPQLRNDAVFYHDCDIVFTRYPDFLTRLGGNGDNDWYVSDTISYIGAKYILSKGEEVLTEMCKIVGINEALVIDREEQSGGAQYVMKNLDWLYWHKVEKDSERLFKEISALNHKKVSEDPKHHALQIWCADMWAVLWNAWMRGYDTNIVPELSFCWATDAVSGWEKHYIFHNAGVTDALKKTHFFKGMFRDVMPYLYDGQDYDENKASYKYWELIKSIGQNSVLYE
jgi:hypothetical protein